ncbi:MAG: phospholipase D family protein [Porticoccaceae bacterium]
MPPIPHHVPVRKRGLSLNTAHSSHRAPHDRGWCTLTLLLCLLLGGCALPSLEGRPYSLSLTPQEAHDTALGRVIRPEAQKHPGMSGIRALRNPHDAFAARLLLARAAERTLDIQYYIWHKDVTGVLMLEAVHNAAKRGVRVRLLLDDNGIRDLDAELAALDTHPNIEVRLFNPFVVRTPKWIGYLTDFSRLNRRMHNKSFTADSMATIIGGRNMGDEYFGATDGILFADLDVFAAGPVAQDVSADFDRYWASASSYPVSSILPPGDPALLEHLTATVSDLEGTSAASAYVAAVRNSKFIERLLEADLDLEWADVSMISDDPAKGLGGAAPEGLLIHQMNEILGVPEKTMDLVSPYFVPTAAGVEAFSAMVERGVEVKVLTNSLDATDVAAVHAGYAKRRKDLLEGGILLYEMRRLSPELERNKSAGPFGSSGSSLHAKTFAVDDERVFIGSFNFDPRSANLNTELGFVIDSPTLATRIDSIFRAEVLTNSYQVALDEDGNLYWLEKDNGDIIRHTKEPRASFWRRSMTFLVSLLPIEWLL